MPKPLSFGHVGVELTTAPGSTGGAPGEETPLRVALLGDFSARASRSPTQPVGKLADRGPVLVDRDNVDEVLKKLGVELQLSLGGENAPRLTIRFEETEDFHPDRLFQRVEVFQALRDLRTRLSDPSTFAAAAAEMKTWGATAPAPAKAPQEKPAPPPPKPPADSHDLLEQILGGTPAPPPAPAQAPGAGDWQGLIQKIVEPYLSPGIDYARQAQLLSLVDEVAGRQMRGLLHHPAFQALEAAWRAVLFLVHRLETDARLKLYLLDVPRAEWAADLAASDDLRQSGLYRVLVEKTVHTPGAQPWGILVGLYTFDRTRDDVELLGRMARVARQASAPFLAAASSRVLGCESLARTPDPDDWPSADGEDAHAWEELRRLPEATAIGLALPRLLLRLPYGRENSATEQFPFEEMPEGADHEDYLWGNPAVACAYLMAEAFREDGWSFVPGSVQEIDRLPLHVYRESGESQVKPCAEVVLTERALEAVVARGLMPLVSFQGRGEVRVPWFQSLARPESPLVGRWAT